MGNNKVVFTTVSKSSELPLKAACITEQLIQNHASLCVLMDSHDKYMDGTMVKHI